MLMVGTGCDNQDRIGRDLWVTGVGDRADLVCAYRYTAIGWMVRSWVYSPRSTRMASWPLARLASTPAAVTGRKVDLAFVAAVLPLVHEVLAQAGAAQATPEPQPARPDLDGHVRGRHRRNGSQHHQGSRRLVDIDGDGLRAHVGLGRRRGGGDLITGGMCTSHVGNGSPPGAPTASSRSAASRRRQNSRTSRPRVPPASSRRWASGAWSAGRTAATRRVTAPSSTSWRRRSSFACSRA